jgi:aryl-alcohol dehydrogenase (NADP+)
MEYNRIPGTDLNVSRVCVGTMTLADQVDSAAAARALDIARERGVNFIDTADVYSRKTPTGSESMLGELLGAHREEFILATKAGGPVGPNPGDRGLSRAHLTEAVENSLRRLRTDRIDLYYAHHPDPSVAPEDFLETMNGLVDSGKIRYYGISNFSAWQLLELVLKAGEMGLRPPVATESVYNLLTRGIESELIPCLRKYPMGLVAYNPLAGGLLSGKYTSVEEKLPGTRFALEKGYAMRYWSEQNFLALSRLEALAKEGGFTLLSLSLKWLLAREEVSSIILGFSRPEQLEQNIDAVETPGGELPEKELAELWRELSGARFNYHN